MLQFLVRRLLAALLVLLSVSLLTFVIARLVPSNPAALYAGQRPTEAQIASARKRLGLDRPLPVQYAIFMGDMLRGDLGVSFKTKHAIAEDLKIFFPSTLELVLAAMALSGLIGLPLGVMAGANAGSWFDRVSRLLTISGVSIPSFWLVLILQLLLSGWLGILPLSGRVSRDIDLLNPIGRITGLNVIDAILTGNWDGLLDVLHHLILPTVVLATYPLSLVFRMTRVSMLETLREKYIVAAQARGVTRARLLFRHALKNALIPSLNVLGLSFAFALTGSVLIEVVFVWPGLGKYITDAILNADFPVIIAVTLLVAVVYVCVNFIMDVLQAVLDPRVAAL